MKHNTKSVIDSFYLPIDLWMMGITKTELRIELCPEYMLEMVDKLNVAVRFVGFGHLVRHNNLVEEQVSYKAGIRFLVGDEIENLSTITKI